MSKKNTKNNNTNNNKNINSKDNKNKNSKDNKTDISKNINNDNLSDSHKNHPGITQSQAQSETTGNPSDFNPSKTTASKSYDRNQNLAAKKRELAEEAIPASAPKSEGMLELQGMSAKERRQYKRQKEKEQLAELTFWRKVQYIITYDWYKFAAIIGGILFIIWLAKQIYLMTCPIALDVVLVNDSLNTTFADEIELLYRDYTEVPDNALFYVDSNLILHPNDEEYFGTEMAYYTKIYSAITSQGTNFIIMNPAVLTSYTTDGYFVELKHGLPEDLFEFFQDRLYECDGPVEDSDYYAIDLTGTKFAELTQLGQESPLFAIPAGSSAETREVTFDFLRMIMELEQK